MVSAPESMEKICAYLTRNRAEAGWGDGANSLSESVTLSGTCTGTTSATLYDTELSPPSQHSRDGGSAKDSRLQTGGSENGALSTGK